MVQTVVIKNNIVQGFHRVLSVKAKENSYTMIEERAKKVGLQLSSRYLQLATNIILREIWTHLNVQLFNRITI